MKRLAALIASLCVASAACADTLYAVDSWVSCGPCKQVEAALHKAGVPVKVTETAQQYQQSYPVAHFVSDAGARYQEHDPGKILRAINSGKLRYTNPVQVRMWTGQ